MGFDNVPTLSGLLHIISTKTNNFGYLETVLSWNHFWGNALQQPSFTPFSHSSNNVFEYLEMFEVNDPTFYSHCKNNNMDLKMWEKKENSFKELLNIPVPLHPFFAIFGNPINASQFHKEKMPVVSLTGWIDVNIGSKASPILSANIHVALAIGTIDQLNAFKSSRSITIPCTTSRSDNPTAKGSDPTAVADMLSTFIDNLALSLPKRVSESDQRQQYSTDPRHQLRPTSDLLDVLHSALKNPTPNLITSATALPLKLSGAVDVAVPPKMVKVKVCIDSARNLPSSKYVENVEDSDDPYSIGCTYVTYDGVEWENGVHYIGYATAVHKYSCNPQWNETMDVMLPADLLQEGNDKKYILKMFRKTHTKRHGPGPLDYYNYHEMIGASTVDLSSLSSESPISGYYSIVDAAGHVNGQLKIRIVLIGDVDCLDSSQNSAETLELPTNFEDLNTATYQAANAVLSRTLKKQFTELEEISERLKSRLLDVTADDGNFEVVDEFENDLNTSPNEDDMDIDCEFDWKRFSTLEIDCGTSDMDMETVAVDRVDSVNLPADENVSFNVRTHE